MLENGDLLCDALWGIECLRPERLTCPRCICPICAAQELRVTPKRKAPHLINHLPRAIRARVAKAAAAIKGAKRQDSSDSSGSPNQEGARSPTGRIALGPWSGPYIPHPDSPTSASATLTLYLDIDGLCYDSLNGGEDRTSPHVLAKSSRDHLAHVVGDAVADKALANATATRMRAGDDAAAARRHQQLRLHSACHTPAHWAPGRGQRARKMMHISQPRASNY